jgi:hypothetical protein
MARVLLIVAVSVLISSTGFAASRSIEMFSDADGVAPGSSVSLQCDAVGSWKLPIKWAKIVVRDPGGRILVKRQKMDITESIATYTYTVPADANQGDWSFKCIIKDRRNKIRKKTAGFSVADGNQVENPVGEQPDPGAVAAHSSIIEYRGPSTCIACHREEASEMLDSLHMKWSGPTPDLTNTNGEELGKAVGGINTFCTYAMSSKGACFSCHVRADGNAPHPPEANDVDCLMCHSDTYQRKFVADPDNTETVTNVLGETKTYVFGAVDADGNYTTEPDFDKMPAGTTMVDIARSVHMPTSASCLRCHAKAGGGDWTKRGDMGLSSADPTVDEDVHLSKSGANLACVDCHSALNHKISGRGIDLRQTEAASPTCSACHTRAPHDNAALNRHATGQVSCQVCHIRTYAKGGATEMSRDWRNPVWNAAFCSGQGGFVGEEIKRSNVKPEYVWFDGTSYVYNIGETISPEPGGVYSMAKASGSPFDSKSSIVPIKRHGTVMPLHESGRIIPPAIMWMFMTGDFDLAVQKGMEEQGMSGNYSLVEAEAEMLITHGVDPKEKAPSCVECHSSTGLTQDGTKMLPFTALGYHELPQEVRSCTLCHSQKTLEWESMHATHRNEVSCSSCHTSDPTGLTQSRSALCSSCHGSESWESGSHRKHIGKGIECSRCHTFS